MTSNTIPAGPRRQGRQWRTYAYQAGISPTNPEAATAWRSIGRTRRSSTRTLSRRTTNIVGRRIRNPNANKAPNNRTPLKGCVRVRI